MSADQHADQQHSDHDQDHGPGHQPDPLDAWLSGPPCPPWCQSDDGPGHPFSLLGYPDPEEPDGAWERLHVRAVVDLSPWGVQLIVEQTVTAHAADLPDRTTLHPARVELLPSRSAAYAGTWAGIGRDRPATADLRHLATLLLEAADLLDGDPALPATPAVGDDPR